MSNTALFQQYLKLADKLAAHASKEVLAECARLLAFNVAHAEMAGREVRAIQYHEL